jgi:hypothetical protein
MAIRSNNFYYLTLWCRVSCNTIHLKSQTFVTVLDIIHSPVFYLRHNVTETRFFLHL